jgi:hypothetical protein
MMREVTQPEAVHIMTKMFAVYESLYIKKRVIFHQDTVYQLEAG